jgi:hypothetical protein
VLNSPAASRGDKIEKQKLMMEKKKRNKKNWQIFFTLLF